MIPLQDFEAHLQTLHSHQWQALFNLLPQIEAVTVFGVAAGGDRNEDGSINMPYIEEHAVIAQFLQVVEALQLAPVFDWPQWQRGKDLLAASPFTTEGVSLTECCQLLTVMIRANRFSEGYLAQCFDTGKVLAVIKVLWQKINSSTHQ